jgi:NADH:ubiquinone reductase (H+-translocating)
MNKTIEMTERNVNLWKGQVHEAWREMTAQWDYWPPQMPRKMKKTRIVIAGGGFAGLYAAMHFDKRLARHADVEVTLISRENFILFTPMLHEVAAGDLYPGDIVNPLRRILRHVKVVEADVRAIDLNLLRVYCVGGVAGHELEFEFDHLLLTLGSETNFFNMDGVRDWSVTMKSLSDAALLRNRMVALLEEASLQSDEAARRQLLTFVTAGGGFSGTETTGAVNDFVRETVRYYPQLREELIRVVAVHPGNFVLPELGEELGRYAEQKLRERKVEVIKGARVANYDGAVVTLSDGTSIPAATLIWTAGVKPSPVIASLGCKTERGRLLVNESFAVPGAAGLWAAGDCAAIPDAKSGTGKFYPPTAQHGLREGVAVAKNIEASILGRPLKPFRFKMLGQLASIGHRTGVAMVFGIKFSGFIAWWFWRSVYLMKLPRLAKKLRVMVSWTLDLFFGQEIEQMITVRDIEELSGQLARIRARTKGARSTSAASVLANSGRNQPE